MVGSGFSRNADPVSPQASPMPNWAQLAGALCEPLYPHDISRREAALAEASGTSGFLRLAQEYQVAFGPGDLNARIRSLVPDTDYRPGDLHTRLLKLPWAEVFSTNWDTLLERACADVLERSYDVVRSPAEIPFTTRPRIVKLHGSFPSHSPFVFTEEDYRTFPKQFAPFVNLVQQAMMETIFCLVGFSGDDPNFLHWSGWVRDNLGDAAPKTYLVGWLELSNHRRRMLEARNVMPIDLSALPQATKWPRHLRQRYATEWFIAALELGRPSSPARWPKPREVKPTPASYLEPLPELLGAEPVLEPWSPRSREMKGELSELTAAVETWRANRLLYPGWLIAPEQVRSRLWEYARSWSSTFRDLAALGQVERLLAVSEYAWRIERSLMPLVGIPDDVVIAALKSVDVVGRKVGELAIEDDQKWEQILSALEIVARNVARNARFELDPATHALAVGVLERIAEHNPSIQNALTYERCLWDLANGEMAELRRKVMEWQPGDGDSLSNLRKAGLLAELCDFDGSCVLLERTLDRIRRSRRRDIDDFTAYSLESWALYLALPFVGTYRNDRPRFTAETPEPFERWRELAVVECDAFHEWQSLRKAVRRSAPVRKKFERTVGFDLGARSTTHNLGNGIPESVVAAYQISVLSDVTGIPAFVDNVTLFGDGMQFAAIALSDSDHEMASQLAIRGGRSGTTKSFDIVFSRERVARFRPALVGALKGIGEKRLDYFMAISRSSEDEPWLGFREIATAVELLSRIAVRLPDEELRGLLTLALDNYSEKVARWQMIRLRHEWAHLVQRCIEALSSSALEAALPELFSLPLPKESADAASEAIADPLSYISKGFKIRSRPDDADTAWRSTISELLQSATSDDKATRGAAVYRLFLLHQWSILTAAETESFASAIWSAPHQLDGLPSNTNLEKWVLAILPEATPGQAPEALRAYVDEIVQLTDWSTQRKIATVGETLAATARRGIQVELRAATSKALKALVVDWIDAREPSKQDAQEPFSRLDDFSSSAAINVGAIIARVSLPKKELERLWEKAYRMDEGLEGGGRLGATLYPTLAVAFPRRAGELLKRLHRSLMSDDDGSARQAMVAVCRWIEAASYSPAVEMPQFDETIREIGIIIASRRSATLSDALGFASWLFENGPEVYRAAIASDCEYGLEALLIEAAYARVGQPYDLPIVRAGAVSLAYAMDRAGYGSSVGVREWLANAPNDPLPEVRNAGDQLHR